MKSMFKSCFALALVAATLACGSESQPSQPKAHGDLIRVDLGGCSGGSGGGRLIHVDLGGDYNCCYGRGCWGRR